MNVMTPPKILPYISRKFGISEELALTLWRCAVSETTQLTGLSEGSEFIALAKQRWFDQIGYEVALLGKNVNEAASMENAPPAPSKTHALAFAKLPFELTRNTFLCWTASYQLLAKHLSESMSAFTNESKKFYLHSSN